MWNVCLKYIFWLWRKPLKKKRKNVEKCRTHLFYFSPHWKKRCTCFANRTVANILSSRRTRAARPRFEGERRRTVRVTATRVPCYSLAPPTAERSRAVAEMAEFHRSYDQRRDRRWSRKNSREIIIRVSRKSLAFIAFMSCNSVDSHLYETLIGCHYTQKIRTNLFVFYFLYYSFQGTLSQCKTVTIPYEKQDIPMYLLLVRILSYNWFLFLF